MKKRKKLNNKGMTAVEVLVCFVLIVVIVVSMYTTTNAYQNKQNVESAKQKITTYKNLLSKEINNDIIKRGLASVHLTPFISYNATDTNGDGIDDNRYNVQLSFRDGEVRCLQILSNTALDFSEALNGCRPSKIDDSFKIFYGYCDDLTAYPLPDLGFATNACDEKVNDLRISSVDIDDKDYVLNVNVTFFHQDLGTKHSFNIVAPINFS